MNSVTEFMASHSLAMGHGIYLYSVSIAAAFILAWLLRKSVPNIVGFVWQMLILTAVILFASFASFLLSYESISSSLYNIGVLIFGLLIIRQICLVFLRLIIPRFGLHPPRILEELLILLAYIIWVLIQLSILGLDLSSLVTSTAVVTAVIAFAMQDTLGNILSGLALQLDHSFHIGDWIELEKPNNDLIQGKVIQVQWRHTAIETINGERVLVPNSILMKSLVVLTGGMTVPIRRRAVYFYCDFGLDPAQVIRAVEYALANANIELVSNKIKPSCIINNMDNGMVTYAVYYWLSNPRSPGQADSFIRQHVIALFQRNNWRFSAPYMDLGVYNANPKQMVPQMDSAELSNRCLILRSNSLFDPLSDDEIEQLSKQLQIQQYVSGSLLAKQGEIGDCLFILVSGVASVWLETENENVLLAELGQDQIIGEMSLMTGEPRRATVMAKTDVVCYMLDHDGFKKILQQRPVLAESFADLLFNRKNELASAADKLNQPAARVEKDHILKRIRQLFSK